LADLTFGVSQLILLRLATRDERSPATPAQRSRRKIVIAAVVLLVAVAVSVGWFRLFREVPQSLGSIEEQFKYGSIGAEQEQGLPYWLWLVLPRMFPEKLPGPGGYTSLGLTWEEGQEMPIGLSKKTVGFPRVAINCAFCHTSRMRTAPNEKPNIYPGGTGQQFDSQSYQRFLFACASDPRFTPAAILQELEYVYDFSWFDTLLYRYLILPQVKAGLLEQKEAFVWTEKVPDWGHGRIDPFNPVKFGILKQPLDGTIGNSDMEPIWNLRPREGMSFHWDGLNNVVREVMLSSAIGDGATHSSLPLDHMVALEAWLMDLKPPAYPFPIDKALAESGRPLYEKHCASCHDFGQPKTGTVIPQEQVGTDRHRLDMWTTASAAAYNEYAAAYDWDFNHFQKANGYVAVPLDGIWIRAPYLHNGSVPSLRDLLEAPDQRPDVFYRGYDVYDPVNVGFISNVSQEAGSPFTRFDTSEPGNDNGGHVYGAGLTAKEKEALLEYMKTL
jgi:mono/diheme cytochrome c family protein